MHTLFFSLIINQFPFFLALILNIVLIAVNKKSSLYWLIIFFVFLILNIGYIILLLYFQYKIWLSHPISKYLLPPYTPFIYFLSYTYHHIYKDFLWSLIGAFLILLIMEFTHNIFKNSLFYPDEFLRVPILASFLKWPLGILFFISGLLGLLFYHFINAIKFKEKVFEKISLRNYWVFLSLFFIIFNIYIAMKNLNIFDFLRP